MFGRAFQLKTAVNDFLKKHELNADHFDHEELVSGFIREMEKGLKDTSSLQMEPSYIVSGDIRKGVPVCVADLGGTFLRTAKAVVDDDGVFKLLSDVCKIPIPGRDCEIAGEAFFETIAGQCAPFTEEGGMVAISFAFPAKTTPDLDAEILYFDKEVKVTGISGKKVGEMLAEALAAKGKRPSSVTVINDSVATCLSGMAEHPDGHDSYIGTILGTGVNCCYFEDISNIVKVGSGSGRMLINMEAGGYAGAPRNDIDYEFSRTLVHPDEHIIEQQVSGAYIGPLSSFTLNRAAAEGVIDIKGAIDVTSKDIDDLLRYGSGAAADMIEKDSLDDAACIAAAVVKRATVYATLQMCAAVTKTGSKTPCITIEGSTYNKLCGFKDQMLSLMGAYFEKRGVSATYTDVENAVLKGCAISALMR